MSVKRRKFSAAFKSRIALQAIRGRQTINEIAIENGLHPNQIATWKKQGVEKFADLFQDGRGKRSRTDADLNERLYSEIGRLKMELDWLKKKSEI